jgi:Leucine rich repeat
MSGAESLAPGDAIPVVDAATRALEARRLHHRQMLRRGFITAVIVAIVILLTAVAFPVFYQLQPSWLMRGAGFSVDWQIDEDNWKTGGVTNVTYNHRSWQSGSRDLELRILPRLLNVESLSLSECPVTEQGLAILRGLDHLKSLNLARLEHLRYGSPLTGLSDGCLMPIQGLSQLQNLTLSGNRITNDGLALLARMPALESLDLDATDITDAGLVHLQGLKKLKSLSLGGTLVTPQAARRLQSALPGLEISFDISPDVEQNLKRMRREPR